MAGRYRGEDRRRENAGWTGPERRSRFAPGAGGQLLEAGGTGDVGGAVSLGDGIFEGQGTAEGAPRYGDWTRHSSGTTSGARGHEGVDFPGENTWGEEEAERERKE